MHDPHRIADERALREIIPEPSAITDQKIFDHVDAYAARFIEHSALVLVSTVGADGHVDVSPKGDAPGFVRVVDPATILLPERPGNRLAYGFRNLLSNDAIGLLFVVPGVTETLRVHGRAELTRDPEILEALAARNRPALLATRVRVEKSFFHCGKAFIRSALWKPESWPNDVKADIGRQIAARRDAAEGLAEAIEDGLREDYETNLY